MRPIIPYIALNCPGRTNIMNSEEADQFLLENYGFMKKFEEIREQLKEELMERERNKIPDQVMELYGLYMQQGKYMEAMDLIVELDPITGRSGPRSYGNQNIVEDRKREDKGEDKEDDHIQ